MGDTNIELRLAPVALAGQAEPVARGRVAFYADDPAAVVRALRAWAIGAGD